MICDVHGIPNCEAPCCAIWEGAKPMTLKEMTNEKLLRESFKNHISWRNSENPLSFNQYDVELLRRFADLEKKVVEGEKAKDFIDLLLAEFQDGMDEKLFYEMTNEYIKDHQNKDKE